MANFINNPAHWAKRAEKLRRLADQTDNDLAKLALLRLASDLDELAQRAVARSDGRAFG